MLSSVKRLLDMCVQHNVDLVLPGHNQVQHKEESAIDSLVHYIGHERVHTGFHEKKTAHIIFIM